MKYATRINSFLRTGLSVKEAIFAIGKIDGIDYVDMNYPEHFKGFSIEEIGRILQEAGLRLNAINLRFRDEFLAGAFDNPSADIRSRAVGLCREAAGICKQLNGQQCIIWLGFDGFDYSFQLDDPTAWNNLVSCFREVCQCTDCRISVEYKPYEEREFAMVDSTGMTLYLIDCVDRQNIGCTLDFCHMLMKHDEPSFGLALAASKGKLFGLHMNDGYGYKDSGIDAYGLAGALKSVRFLDALTVYKDRRPYPHRLSDAVESYALVSQNTHRAIDDTHATYELLCAMDAEAADLDRYINLFGYSAKYGLPKRRISSVSYRPQGFDAVGKLYDPPCQDGAETL